MSGLTLSYVEDDEPACRVVFGGGRLIPAAGKVDDRRIEVSFSGAYHVRLGPLSDSEGISSVGYAVLDPYDGAIESYLDWLNQEWSSTGICPDPRFYVALQSDWADQTPSWTGQPHFHYVLAGRDGYVEVLAERYIWREWMWKLPRRDDNAEDSQIVAQGEGGI